VAPKASENDDDEPLGGPLVEIAAEGDINADERFKVWVAAGARCAFCGRYLMVNDEQGVPARIGEMAHIVGRTTNARSPRGKDSLPAWERNKAENLILACPGDHTTVDKKAGVAIWETDDLRRLKQEHEDAIHRLTGMTKDRATTVLRVAGEIRGTTPSIARSVVLEAVHAELRFPRYELTPAGDDVEIDLVSNYNATDSRYLEETDAIIARRVERIAERIAAGEIGHISVFAFARIPVLVQLGHHLDDKWPVELHPFDRTTSSWTWAPNDNDAPLRFQTAQLTAADPERVTLILSLSGQVDHGRLPVECVNGATVYEMTPAGAQQGVMLIRSREGLLVFVNEYLAFLAMLERDHSNAQAIDIVPAVGLPVAVELGRRRTRSKHPRLRVWDQTDDGDYVLATEVG
jgi:SMODS-associated and fused to various effectors sensor domain